MVCKVSNNINFDLLSLVKSIYNLLMNYNLIKTLRYCKNVYQNIQNINTN